MKCTAIFQVLFFALFSLAASAQKTNTWRGGAPGHDTDWQFYKNWSSGRTPDEFDRVIIPDVSTSTGKNPIIRSGTIEVASLEIQSGASLTLLRDARLLSEKIMISGACKGCDIRVIIEGGEKTASVFMPE